LVGEESLELATSVDDAGELGQFIEANHLTSYRKPRAMGRS